MKAGSALQAGTDLPVDSSICKQTGVVNMLSMMTKDRMHSTGHSGEKDDNKLKSDPIKEALDETNYQIKSCIHTLQKV